MATQAEQSTGSGNSVTTPPSDIRDSVNGVPRVGQTPQYFPPGFPLDGVTEIRVHGVGGATPERLLDDPYPTQVSGDRMAGFYRASDHNGRHVEGYSWGGLTSRSWTRVLWLLLTPFMLANMAGWAAPRSASEADPDERPTSGLYLFAARAAALAVTINLILMVLLGALDILAYQTWNSDHPGRRLALGGPDSLRHDRSACSAVAYLAWTL